MDAHQGQAHAVAGPGGPRVQGAVEAEICSGQQGGAAARIVLDDVDGAAEVHPVARGEVAPLDVLPGAASIGAAPEVLDGGAPAGVGGGGIEDRVVQGVEPHVAEGHLHAACGIDSPLVDPGGATIGTDPTVGRIDDDQLQGIRGGAVEVPDEAGPRVGKAAHGAGRPGLAEVGGLEELVVGGRVGGVAGGIRPARLHPRVEGAAACQVDARVAAAERAATIQAVAQVDLDTGDDDLVAIQLVDEGAEAIAGGVGLVELGAGSQCSGPTPGAVVLETNGHPRRGVRRSDGVGGAQVVDQVGAQALVVQVVHEGWVREGLAARARRTQWDAGPVGVPEHREAAVVPHIEGAAIRRPGGRVLVRMGVDRGARPGVPVGQAGPGGAPICGAVEAQVGGREDSSGGCVGPGGAHGQALVVPALLAIAAEGEQRGGTGGVRHEVVRAPGIGAKEDALEHAWAWRDMGDAPDIRVACGLVALQGDAADVGREGGARAGDGGLVPGEAAI